MLKIHRFHLGAIGIVATLVTGCAVVDPSYYDAPSSAPVYQERYRDSYDPYYGGSPGYYDNRPSHREYPPPRNDWRDHEDRSQRNRARPDHRDGRDVRDDRPDRSHAPRPQAPALNNPPPQSQPQPKVKPHEDAPREHPPRSKSDRYNPKTGQYLPSADDMP